MLELLASLTFGIMVCVYFVKILIVFCISELLQRMLPMRWFHLISLPFRVWEKQNLRNKVTGGQGNHGARRPSSVSPLVPPVWRFSLLLSCKRSRLSVIKGDISTLPSLCAS